MPYVIIWQEFKVLFMNPSEKNWELEQELGLWGKVARFSKTFFKWYWKKIQQRLIFFKKNQLPVKFELQKNNAQYLGQRGGKSSSELCLSEIQN